VTRYKPAGSPSVGWPAYVLKIRERLAAVKRPDHDPFVLLVTGSQDAEGDVWRPVVADCLAEVCRWVDGEVNRHKILRHGGARGIDAYAHSAGRRQGFNLDRIPSEWRHWGRRSGILRNQFMVDRYPYPDLCLAFFANSTAGTADCATRARQAGVLTIPITVEDLYFPHAKA
jgi:hypothetical protein